MDKFKYCIILFFLSQSLYALTTCNVTLPTDNNPGGTGDPGDLRSCINSMNTNLNTTPDDYAILFNMPMTIQLNGLLPIINNSPNPVNITIGNSGSTQDVIIDGNSGAFSGFFIPMGNVTIQNMVFQNMTAKGGNGGDGIAGGGGGLGAGGAIYVPEAFLYGSNPAVTLINVSINNTSAVGGNGGSYIGGASTGDEGGGGGGGFSGNGGSITTTGITGGGGGGGFGGNGGDVTLSYFSLGGGGGGGGGIGSRAQVGPFNNLGDGGSDQNSGSDGNLYGPTVVAGAGGGSLNGGNNAGGGGGGNPSGVVTSPGGGGGGSAGIDGMVPQGNIPPMPIKPPMTQKQLIRGSITLLHQKNLQSVNPTTRRQSVQPSGGMGGDGGGGGGAGVVTTSPTNGIDGQAADGGYGGGGGGGAGTGAYDTAYTVRGGTGGMGGGGGGGGVNQSGSTSSDGGNSSGGGGGGGGGPGGGSGGSDIQNLGGGSGGNGDSSYGAGLGGGGGGGGSGLGGAIFIDKNLAFTVQAIPNTPTVFNTTNTTTQAGNAGNSAPGASGANPGSALGNSIFLRSGASLILVAENANDLLTLGNQVAFTDDTTFGGTGTSVAVRGNGTIIYNGTTDYQGSVTINNANFKVNGLINQASIAVCRNVGFSPQRGTLSGTGTLTGSVSANSGTISPDPGSTLTLGSLTLNAPASGTLGSKVHIDISPGSTSLVAVTNAAALAGNLEISLDPSTPTGSYTILTSSGITGTFDSVTFTGTTPNYTLSYLPIGAPTYVQFNFTGYPTTSVDIPATVNGSPIVNPAVVCCGRPVILGPLPVPGNGPTVYTVTNHTGSVTCKIGQTDTQTYLKMEGKSGSCTVVGTKNGVVSNPLTVIAAA